MKEGQFGPYSVVSIGGASYSAFGRHHQTISRMKVGDDIEFTAERKGNYDRIASIGGGGGGSNTSPSGGSVPASTPTKSDFPISMKVSYAKDLLVGNTASTAKEAVTIINELEAEFKKAVGVPDPLASSGKN